MAYYRLEPFGTEADWLQAGTITATIANVNSPNRRFTPDDFMPDYGNNDDQDSSQSPDEQRAIIEAFSNG